MKNYFVVFSFIILALSGCHSSGPGLTEQVTDIGKTMAVETGDYYKRHGEKATIKAAKEAVKNTLKDPSSAQFTNLRIKEYAQGRLVCGSVNAKNSFGGYVGNKTFAASPSVAMLYSASSNVQFINNEMNTVINEACAR